MKKFRTFYRTLPLFALMGCLFSCTKEEERLTEDDTADVISESLIDAYFEDADDMSLAAVTSDESPTGGRIASDDRFCTAVLFNGTGLSGEITLDFGSGCTDPRGNTRSGIIRMDYSGGPAGTTGFTVTMTFDGYTVNGVQLDGTRTVRRIASGSNTIIRHEITLTDGTATWPDGTVSTRSSAFIRELDGQALAVRLDGSAQGLNRRGRPYQMNINETLVFRGDCVLANGIYMAVDGVKTFTSGGRSLVIDYGDGACDRSVTVKAGNAATSLTVGS